MTNPHSRIVSIRPALQHAISRQFDYDDFSLTYDLSLPRERRFREARISCHPRIAADPVEPRMARADVVTVNCRAVIIQREMTVHEFLNSKPPNPHSAERPATLDDIAAFVASFRLVAMQHTTVCYNTSIFDKDSGLMSHVGFQPAGRDFEALMYDRKERGLLIDDLVILRK